MAYIEQEILSPTPLIYVSAYNATWQHETIDAGELRSNEQEVASVDDGNYISIHDLRPQTQLNAGLSIGTTLFVCFVLATAAVFFTHTTNTLVINPIEEMIAKVNRISMNPLLAA
mmetsp:Transcript_21847/g.16206  ORF Transcript_21847/g.16206 Transcript_21847/m.16206 type:complete len:115 (+) Transcript_21847:1172-1516(+)